MYTQQYHMYYNQPQYRYKNRFDMAVFTGLLHTVPLPIFIGVGLAITIILAIALSRNKKPAKYVCHQYDDKDRLLLAQGKTGKQACESKPNRIFTQGNNDKYPDCGSCWCCKKE